MATFKISGAAPALLLAAALLAAGAGADPVTAAPCRGRKNQSWTRLRRYPEDSNATSLWMNICGLTELNIIDIENLPHVDFISLTFNSIAYINTSALRTVPALMTLSLHGNIFREPPIFAEGSCPNLIVLYLSNNQLTAVGAEETFSACKKLIKLLLGNNAIEFLHPDMFKALVELKRLELDNNKIKYIPSHMFIRNDKLNTLLLNDNRLTHLPPDFPGSLKRVGASLEEFDFHSNPWHCPCLLEQVADVKRAGVSNYDYWAQRYDGTAPVCVYTGPAPCCRRAPSGLLRPAGGAR